MQLDPSRAHSQAWRWARGPGSEPTAGTRLCLLPGVNSPVAAHQEGLQPRTPERNSHAQLATGRRPKGQASSPRGLMLLSETSKQEDRTWQQGKGVRWDETTGQKGEERNKNHNPTRASHRPWGSRAQRARRLASLLSCCAAGDRAMLSARALVYRHQQTRDNNSNLRLQRISATHPFTGHHWPSRQLGTMARVQHQGRVDTACQAPPSSG